MKIGYYLNLAAKNSSLRIRYMNILKQLPSDKFEIYDSNNNAQYTIVLFGKTFSDIDIKKAKQLKAEGKSIYFDLCDNYFYNPHNLQEYKKYANNIKTMLLLADKVILSSEKLKFYVVSQTPEIMNKTIIIEDTYETELIKNRNLIHEFRSKMELLRYRYFLQKNHLNIFWFGNASSKNATAGMLDLLRAQAVLEKFSNQYKVHLTVMSNNAALYNQHIKGLDLATTYLAWNSNIFIDILTMQDAVLIPITPNPFTECKTNNRLIQTLIHGVDVIADIIPSYQEFSECCFLNDWLAGLTEVAKAKRNNKTKQERLMAAREIIEKKYHINTIAKKWQDAFEDN